MAKKIVEHLMSEGMAEPAVPMDKLIAGTEALIMEELTIEDRVNDEVREVLKKYDSEINKGRLDYKKLFDLTKQKIVRERNIVL